MPEPHQSPLRLAVHGLGAVAQSVHLPLLARLPDRFRIAAVCDLSASVRDAVGTRWGVPEGRRHASLDSMIAAGDLDGLVILTAGSHAEPAIAGLEAGLAVLCEKPLAYTLEEVEQVAAALGRTNGRLQVAYMKVYDPAVAEARRVIAAGELGELRAAEVTVLHPTSESQLAFAHLLPPPTDIDPATLERLQDTTRHEWHAALGAEAGASLGALYTDVLLGSIIHDLAVLRTLVGDPVSIDRAETWAEGVELPSVAVGGRFEGGARLVIGWHYLSDYPAYREEVRLHFDRGSVELVFPAPYRLHLPTRLVVRTGSHETVQERSLESVEEAFEQQLFAFERFVREGTPPLASVPEARTDTRTCLAMAARLAEQRGIPLGGEAASLDRVRAASPGA